MTIAPFKSLFLAIQKWLMMKVPELRWIEQDLGQLEMEGRPSVTFPCVLIDFADWKYEDWGENIQKAEGFVVIRLAVDVWSQTYKLAPDAVKQKGLEFYELEWKIYKALQGWKPAGAGDGVYDYMLRVSSNKEDREDNLSVRTIIFSCGFEDYGAAPTYTETPLPGPEFVPPEDDDEDSPYLFPNP